MEPLEMRIKINTSGIREFERNASECLWTARGYKITESE